MSVTSTFETWEFSPIATDSTPLGTYRFEYDSTFRVIVSMWELSNPSTNILLTPADDTIGVGAANFFNTTTEAVNQFPYFQPAILRAPAAFASKYGMAVGSTIVLRYDVNRTVVLWASSAQSLGSFSFSLVSSRSVTRPVTTQNIEIIPRNGDSTTTLTFQYDSYGFIWSVRDASAPSTELIVSLPVNLNNTQRNQQTYGANNFYPINSGGTLINRPASFTNAQFPSGATRFSLGYVGTTYYISYTTDNVSWTDVAAYSFTTSTPTEPLPLCFAKGTLISIHENGAPERQISIEQIKSGMYVSTFGHGPRRVRNVRHQTHRPQPTRPLSCMYRHIHTGLIVTGMHGVLVQSVPDAIGRLYRDASLDIETIDGVFVLHAAFCPGFVRVLQQDEQYDLYHIVLEDDDIYRKFGITANGIVCETMSIQTFEHYRSLKQTGVSMTPICVRAVLSN